MQTWLKTTQTSQIYYKKQVARASLPPLVQPPLQTHSKASQHVRRRTPCVDLRARLLQSLSEAAGAENSPNAQADSPVDTFQQLELPYVLTSLESNWSNYA